MKKRPIYQDPQLLKRLFAKRLWMVSTLVIILTFFLFSRLLYLQIIKKNYYTTLSHSNYISLIPLPPPRGLIYDRHGVLLAENIPAFSLVIVPERVKDLNNTVERLQKIIVISASDLSFFNRELKRNHDFDEIPLKLKLTQAEVARFSADQHEFPGVEVKAGLIRYYPKGADFVSILGYVGRINERDVEDLDVSNYAGTNYIGKIGIEKYFEGSLHGTVGYKEVETDASGRDIRLLKEKPPVPGNDLYLTIDAKLQEKAMETLDGKPGAIVVIQPSTGQVLALASSPSYNPNLFVNGVDPKTYEALRTDGAQPLYNRAIRGQYPLASTIKVFIGLEALNRKFIDPYHKIFDPGYYRINDKGRTWRDWRAHGMVDFVSAIEESCDTYFYQLSVKMGIEPIDAILNAFGFGQYTGIQMNEELPGIVASPDWKLKTTGERWYLGDTLNSSIGQGSMLATPLQLAVATATIANRGYRYQPTLLLGSLSPMGMIMNEVPIELMPVEASMQAWNFVIKGMQAVMSGNKGTAAYRFGKSLYSVAGKTGTAQVYSLKEGEKYVVANVPLNLRDNSMFIAFAPVDHPKIAIAIAVQNESTAVIFARKIMDAYFLNEGYLKKNDEADIFSLVKKTSAPPSFLETLYLYPPREKIQR
jgi:penicillin-binding protein 2